MSPYYEAAKLMELPALVAMATSNHREMSQLLQDNIFSISQATGCLSFSFCVLFCLQPAHWPVHSATRSLDVYVSAA